MRGKGKPELSLFGGDSTELTANVVGVCAGTSRYLKRYL
jgi:hypothetical protein